MPPPVLPPPDSQPATESMVPAAPPRARSSLMSGLERIVLGRDPRRRRFLIVVLSNGLVYAASIAMLIFGSRRGLFAEQPAMILSALMGATVLIFYLLFRSGCNLRLRDPTLSVAQSLAAQTLIAAAYGVIGPVHAVTLVLFPMVTFFAMFHQHPRNGRLVAAYTVALVGAIMWWRSHNMPTVYTRDIEVIYFILLAVTMFAVTQIAAQSSAMSNKLRSQKVALQQALAHIQQMATHDELTGLANRRHALDLLAEHATRHARGGPAFYVGLADLDHFKQINDRHGHAAGDDALRTFAQVARAHLRTTDVIARWGGEEFLVLLPQSVPGEFTPGGPSPGGPSPGGPSPGGPSPGGPSPGGPSPGVPSPGGPSPGGPSMGLERLREALTTVSASNHVPELRIKFSAGLTRFREGEAVAATIERADKALYAAKAGGRDRIVIA